MPSKKDFYLLYEYVSHTCFSWECMMNNTNSWLTTHCHTHHGSHILKQVFWNRNEQVLVPGYIRLRSHSFIYLKCKKSTIWLLNICYDMQSSRKGFAYHRTSGPVMLNSLLDQASCNWTGLTFTWKNRHVYYLIKLKEQYKVTRWILDQV